MKRLIFEVEEGLTICVNCPFSLRDEIHTSCGDRGSIFNCGKYDISTLKFIGEHEKDS